MRQIRAMLSHVETDGEDWAFAELYKSFRALRHYPRLGQLLGNFAPELPFPKGRDSAQDFLEQLIERRLYERAALPAALSVAGLLLEREPLTDLQRGACYLLLEFLKDVVRSSDVQLVYQQ